MTRTTPELAPPLQASTPHQREGVWPRAYGWACIGPNTQPIFNGIVFEPGTLWLRGRHLTTRPPRLPETLGIQGFKVGIQSVHCDMLDAKDHSRRSTGQTIRPRAT
ncbi:hypothetical protein AVEN_19423-1 [Araneus ventricosus]|uniref:Uncharacterized protein n=1 Tax=Araneus ventricosus TaxID=182803 RepID=A0A4Y2C6F2_ARAVE|nr:hypothetical protein AVEN_19423-1 [Araneus ventricosus]